MRVLLVGQYDERKDNIGYAQLFPFFENRTILKKQLGFEFDHLDANTFSEIEISLEAVHDIKAYDAILIRPSWRHTSAEAIEFFARIRQRILRQKLILIDPWDQVTGRYLCVAPYVDCILKYQGLKDNAQYTRRYIGGTIVSDYLVQKRGYDIGEWDVGSVAPEQYTHRILTGWNFATTPRFQKRLFPSLPKKILSLKRRNIDVFCRVNYGPKDHLEWYGRYRMEAIETLQTLSTEYRLAVSGEYSDRKTISTRRYFQELQRARIAFSPFGWGEITWRDYEAIAYGCLLVKPRVDHVDTNPYIFVPGETYVPIEWDFSDLTAKCRYYLENWTEAKLIVNNAQKMYRDFFEKQEFIELVRRAIST